MPESGLFEQFAGFFALEEIDLSRYADRTVPLDVILGRERTQRSQVVKQADVVALLALLPEECDARARLANFRYYEPRCGHGSSLSRGMHALVAARLGEMELATRYFQETAATDLADTSDGSAGGVHIAALGGLWQAAVFGFGGLSLRAEALGLDPRLPPTWRTLGFHAHWRGRLVRIGIDQDADEIKCRLVAGRADAARSAEDSGTRFNRVTRFAPAIAISELSGGRGSMKRVCSTVAALIPVHADDDAGPAAAP